MGSKKIVLVTWIVLWLAFSRKAQSATYEVKKFGAKANGQSDDSQAIMRAWKEACGSPVASTVVISKGDYMVGQLRFQGPCRAPINVHVEGNLKAPAQLKSEDGWVNFQNIHGLTVSGRGIFDGQGQLAWSQNNCAKDSKCSFPINLRFTMLTNSKIQDITSLNSKYFHMNILNCNNLTLQHITINAPEQSLNTDGIHIGRSTGVKIIGADIKTGDDCVSLGDGNQQVSVEKVTCGPGHGISVGSLGKYKDEQPVRGITVRNCTFTNTDNGIRVKTWPASPNGMAADMHFESLIMNNVSTPILIDQQYCPYGQCKAQAPSRVKITNVSFKNIKGSSATQLAVKLVCSPGIPCQNVDLEDINLTYKGVNGSAAISQCSNVKPRVTGKLFPPACTQKP